MKKNDKIVVLLGVAILVIASVGIFYYNGEVSGKKPAEIEDFYTVTGTLNENVPESIIVPDTSPFYALVATPLAVHYGAHGEQYTAPLYVENYTNPSSAVKRVYTEQLDSYKSYRFNDPGSPKTFSLDIAKRYWDKSEAALLIKDNETGYQLGVTAVPIASYLSIPVIVTDEIDEKVRETLEDLGVTKTIVCGDLDVYGNVKSFENVDEIVNTTIDLLNMKFKSNNPDYEINYVTITNPLDAFPPKVLRKEIILSDKGTLQSGNLLPSHLFAAIKSLPKPLWYTVKIPDDYKYALVKLDLINLEPGEDVQQFGDSITLGGSLTAYVRTYAHPAERDANGNIKYDKLHFETVFYDAGGQEYSISLSSSYMIQKSAEFEIRVTAEELSNPYYPLIKQASSIAPYLAANHKGLVYGKTSFAFAADDNVKYNGETITGNTQPFWNPKLIPVINQHVYENIHKPLNSLVAKIKNIDLKDIDLKYLKERCYDDPIYIALVGDTVMLPQYYYRSPHSDPFENPKSGGYGTNCPSDFIYGNIDPEMYSLLPYDPDYCENDKFSKFPEVENIVGRLVGWDVQDISALIDRTLFYDDIIQKLDEWKKKALVMIGAGTEMQKLPVFTMINQLMGDTEPIKFPSGEKYFLLKRIENNYKKGGFNPITLQRGAAQRVGISTEALLKIKKDGLLNKLLFPFWAVKIRQGYENKDSLKSLDWWVNSLFSDGAETIKGGKWQESSNYIITDGHAIWFESGYGDVMLYELGMRPKIFYSLIARYLHIPGLPFRTPLDGIGSYTVREVSNMKMGPSLCLFEGCGSGKIDGIYPKLTLANAYLHAGVNAYISPTTFSAFYGALEPRFGNRGVGLGIVGYLKALKDYKLNNKYPDVYFNQFIFEHAILSMFDDKNMDIGTALRNAKNDFLPAQFDIPFRWTPPLSIIGNLPEDFKAEVYNGINSAAGGGGNTFSVEKYCTIYQINLLGDPMFNPYEPCNE